MLVPINLNLIKTNEGDTLAELSKKQTIMLVFLRHFGCVFCREALSDMSKQRTTIEADGTQIVFVHMASIEEANPYFKQYNLTNISHVSDPQKRIYQAFGLARGGFSQLFGLKVWMRSFQVGREGHSQGTALGDSFQMPGIFIIQGDTIKCSFIHKSAADKPDYIDLSKCCLPQ